MDFGSKLKQLREEINISREELAKKINISYSSISKYEQNARFPDKDSLKKIADFFSVSIDWLLGRTDDRRSVADLIKESLVEYKIKPMSDPLLDDLLKRVPDLTEEEKESLAEHLEFALKQIEKERQRRIKNEQ